MTCAKATVEDENVNDDTASPDFKNEAEEVDPNKFLLVKHSHDEGASDSRATATKPPEDIGRERKTKDTPGPGEQLDYSDGSQRPGSGHPLSSANHSVLMAPP